MLGPKEYGISKPPPITRKRLFYLVDKNLQDLVEAYESHIWGEMFWKIVFEHLAT